jgi:putative MATE family efflux protein
MHIVGFSYLFAAISFVITYNSRSIQDLTVPTTINAIAIGINIFLNYGLIYGHFGMAPMGVEGAALATLIARVVEAVAMVTSIYARKTHPLKATFRQLTGFSRQMFQSVMKTAVPVVINEGLWAVSVSMTLAAYGKIGPSALAIVQVATTVTEFFQTVYFGVGNASAVIIGEALGQGRKKRAWRYSRRIMKITWGLNVIMTLLIIFLRQPIAIIYDFDTATTEMMMKTLLIYAIAMAPKMLAYMTICAILRAGGDTLYCMWLDSVFNMVVQVPLAFFSVMVLNLELHWAVALVAVADFVKVIFCYQRYFSRKWMNVITDVDILEED